ncbi:killer cell lectin-like receptor subfamily B member 1A [Lissotriton helveticus]
MAEDITYADIRLPGGPGLPAGKGGSNPRSSQTPARRRLHCSPLLASLLVAAGLLLGFAVGIGTHNLWRIDVHSVKMRSLEETLERIQQQLQGSEGALQRINVTVNDWDSLLSEKLQFCMDGWQLMKGKCYFFSTSAKTWEKSKEDCFSKGATLATIKDNDTMTFMWEQTKDAGYLIGLRKESQTRTWKWLDGTPLTGFSVVSKYTNTICAKVSSRQLWEEYCTKAHPWVCERPAFTFQLVRVSPAPASLRLDDVAYTSPGHQ